MKVPTPAASTASASPQRPRALQRNISRVKYNESEESSDEKVLAPPPTTVTHKRVLQRTITPQASKRVKSDSSSHDAPEPTIVHIQQQPQQQPQLVQVHVQQPSQQQQQILSASVSIADDKSIGEPEFIDLPMEIPTKSEPEYAEETADEEAIEQDTEHEQDADEQDDQEGEQEEATYVEDESYGDMKYDESYFTENDDTKAGASGFSESYAEAGAEATGTEAQG